MAEEIIIKIIRVDSTQAQQSLGELSDSTEQVTESQDGLQDSLDSLPGPMSNVASSAKGILTQFKAIIASPIGMILAAVSGAAVLLGKGFMSTATGANWLSDKTSFLSGTMRGFTRAIGEASLELKGLFSEGGGGGIGAFFDRLQGVRWEAQAIGLAYEEINKRQRITAELASLQSVYIAGDMKRLEELRTVTVDVTKSFEERIEAAEEAQRVQQSIDDKQEATSARRLKDIEEQMQLEGDSDRAAELRAERAEILVQQIEQQTQAQAIQKEFLTQINDFEAQRVAILLEQQNATEAIEQGLRDQLQVELDLIEQKRQARMQADEEYADFQQDMFDEYSDTSEEWIDGVLDYRLEADIAYFNKRYSYEQQMWVNEKLGETNLANFKLGIAGDLLGAMTMFAEEGSTAQKVLQVADGTRQSIMGAISAYASALQLGPVGLALAPVAAGAALAFGLASVATMAMTGPSPVATPSVSMPTDSEDFGEYVNQQQDIPQTVNIQQGQTVTSRAYVVESEVTAQQEIAKKRKVEASL